MKRPLDPRVPEDEAALFRAEMRDAVPLRSLARHARPQPAHPPVPIQSLLDEHAALDESRTGALDDDSALETGEEIAYVRAAVTRQVLRRLRRGPVATGRRPPSALSARSTPSSRDTGWISKPPQRNLLPS